MKVLLLIIIIGYLLGCIHGSQIVGKYKKINIKKSGMKNSGASNATLLLGWKYGLIVAFIDVGKAVFSLSITMYLINYAAILSDWHIIYILVNGLFVIIGHNFPINMNFNGGKGTASFFGLLLFMNWKFAFISLVVAVVFSFVTNYFVLGTFSGYLLFNSYIAYLYGVGPILIAFLFTILFLLKHADNFKRILRKEEVKLSTLFRKEAG